MYTVLIADDEKLARFAIRSVLEEKLTEIEVIGEADSGDDIIELCEKVEPDIVFMDIHMPGINGLDAASLILRKNPDINIFVLTAYDYFDYIQQAIEIGVKGYILKPIVSQQIVDSIENVKNSIDQKKIVEENTQSIFDKVKELQPAVEEELIWMMVSGKYNKQNIRRYLSFLNIQDFKAVFLIAKYIPETPISQYNSVKKAEANIHAVLFRYLSKHTKCIIGRMFGKNIPVLALVPSENEQQFLSDLKSVAEDIVKKVQVKYAIKIRIGVGSVYESVERMHLSYSEALMALKRNVDICVPSYNEIDTETDEKAATFEYPFDLEKKLVQMMKLNRTFECRDLAIDIVDTIMLSNKKNDKVIEYLESFIVTLKKQLLYIKVPLERIQAVANLRELQSFTEINQIKRWVGTAVDSIIGLLEQNKEDNKINVFNSILQYVNEMYSADISLELVAENVGLTPQYVSKLFKAELGTNFIEYITEKRIASAKHLLKTTKLKIKDVAVESGYSDSNYFCKIFKKYVGQTPKEYHTSYYNS